jgi:hypothetical protein
MVVAKVVTASPYMTCTGTLAEVTQQLSDDGIPPQSIVGVYWDSQANKAVAIYHSGHR